MNLSLLEDKYGPNYIEQERVELNHKLITQVEPQIFDKFSNLKSIDLSNNFISTHSPFLFGSLTHLEIVILHHNFISYIDSQLFKSNSNIKFIDLSNNQISSIYSHTFENLTKLKKIYLHNNLFMAPFLNMYIEESVDFVSFKNTDSEQTVENDICYLVNWFHLIIWNQVKASIFIFLSFEVRLLY